MINWKINKPVLTKSLKEHSLLNKILKDEHLQENKETGIVTYSFPITNSGYDGLHVFLWGLCCDSPAWKIDPYEPEIMGCGWMVYPWKKEEYPQLVDLLSDLHGEVSSIPEDYFVVNSTRIILPAHEEELIDLLVRPGMKETITAMRTYPVSFNIKEQIERIQRIHNFVLFCEELKLDFEINRLYHWRR